MPLTDRSRSITLHCQTCGGVDFEHDPDNLDAPITCAGCGRVYSREELIAQNGEVIQASVDEVKAELVADIRQQFKDMFRGSKFFKVR